jgi:hypothetical protein
MWQCFKSKKRKEQEEIDKQKFLKQEKDQKELEREREEYNRKCYQEMVDFRKVGERFNLLGVTLIVESFGGISDVRNGSYFKTINAKYVDKDGVIREQYFNYGHLQMLRAENP